MKFTPEEISALAKEAGIKLSPAQFSGVQEAEVDEFTLADFAALAAAKEREACAKLCEYEWGTLAEKNAGFMFAAAIRARGQKEGA